MVHDPLFPPAKTTKADVLLQDGLCGTSLVVPYLRLDTAGGAGSIPGPGTKIPHAAGELSPCATTRQPTCLPKKSKTDGMCDG